MFLIVAPTSHGILVYLLPHLPSASGDHLALVRMEVQASWVPSRPITPESCATRFLIGHQFFVRNVKNESARQHRPPMRHDPLVFAVVVCEVRQVEREVEACQDRWK